MSDEGFVYYVQHKNNLSDGTNTHFDAYRTRRGLPLKTVGDLLQAIRTEPGPEFLTLRFAGLTLHLPDAIPDSDVPANCFYPYRTDKALRPDFPLTVLGSIGTEDSQPLVLKSAKGAAADASVVRGRGNIFALLHSILNPHGCLVERIKGLVEILGAAVLAVFALLFPDLVVRIIGALLLCMHALLGNNTWLGPIVWDVGRWTYTRLWSHGEFFVPRRRPQTAEEVYIFELGNVPELPSRIDWSSIASLVD